MPVFRENVDFFLTNLLKLVVEAIKLLYGQWEAIREISL